MSEARSGYRQSFGGLIGAMIAVAAVIVFVWALGWFQHRPTPNPAPTVDYSAALAAARHEAPFHVLAPQPAPTGWRATSVDYTMGRHAAWHLGFVTANGQYVGLEQGAGPARHFIVAKTSANQPAGTVMVDGQRWQRLISGDSSERALVRQQPGDTVVVAGSASMAQLVEFADRLS